MREYTKSYYAKDIAYIAVFIILIATRTFSLLVPVAYAARIEQFYRPIIYCGAVILLYFVNGNNQRPIRKKDETFMVAAIGSLMYFALMLVMSLVDGYATNGMMTGTRSFFINLWTIGSYVLLSELIRYGIIRNAPAKRRAAYAAIITAINIYVQIDGLRSAINYGIDGAAGFFFTAVLPPLMLNVLLTYMAYVGSLKSVLLLHAVYALSPALLPYLPATNKATWSALICTLMFVTAIIHHLFTAGGSRAEMLRERRWNRNQRASFSGMIVPILIILLILAFNMRLFPYYTVSVLTGSMTGTIDQGSIAIVEKVKANEVLATVQKGDIIHYSYGRAERLHRAIEFDYNAAGERVYITKGDANDRPDSYPVTQEQVIGIARGYLPYVGWPFVIIYNVFH